MRKELLEITVCPRCSGKLDETSSDLVCESCSSIYPINRGVPILLADLLPDQQERVEEEKEILDRESHTITQQRMRLYAETIESAKKALLDVCQKVNAKKILNVGCGLDNLYQSFDSNDTIFVSSDIVDEFLVRLIERGAKDVVCADVRNLPFIKESFDVVVCIGLLHHFYTAGIEEPLYAMTEMVRPGGAIVIQEPNKWGFLRLPIAWMPHNMQLMQRRFRAFVTRTSVRPADYEGHLSKGKVIKLLKNANFEKIRVHPTPAYPGDGRATEFYTKIARKSLALSKHLSYNWLLTAIKRGGVA